MPYTPDATVVTEPTDSQKASTAALEFRTLKAYIQTTVIGSLIAGKLSAGTATVTGLHKYTASEGIRLLHDSGFLTGWNAAETQRTGFLQFNAAANVTLTATENIPLQFGVNAATRWRIDASAGAYSFIPLATNTSNVGGASNRVNFLYTNHINAAGTVTANSFVGSGASLTGITGAVSSVAGRTGAVVLTNADVGLSAVENKNSATIRSEITASNVIASLGYTPANSADLTYFVARTAALRTTTGEANNYGSESLDNGNDFAPTTGRWTCPATGLYLFSVSAQTTVSNVTVSGVSIAVILSGAATYSPLVLVTNRTLTGSVSDSEYSLSGTALLLVTAGQYVSVQVTVAGDASCVVQYFAGVRIR